MKAQCIKAVTQAIGRSLTEIEVRDIEARLARNMRNLARQDPATWMAKSAHDKLTEAAESAAKEIVGEKQLKQERQMLSLAAQARIESFVREQAARGIDALDSIDRLIAFHADGKSNTLSVESQTRAVERDALRQMLGTLEGSNPKWFGLFENHDGIRAVVKEIFGEASGVPEAAKGAKEWATVTKALRERFSRAGGDIGELDDWGLPHHHSQTRVAKAGADPWIADTLPLLNRERYYNEDGSRMNDAQLTDFLRHTWTTIATGGANKVIPGRFSGGGMRANRGSESRQVHFKNAGGYLAYQDKYGERSLYEVLTGHISGVSKDIALVETFGPNPDNTFRYWRDRALNDAKVAQPTKAGKFDERAVRTDNLYNVVSGKSLPVASEHLANGFDTLRNWLIGARLGSAVITSFSDEATLHLTSKLNQLPEMRLLANELAAYNPANRMEERLALRAGLAMNTLISSLNRFGQNGLGASFSKKLASTVLRVSGLNAMTEARKRAFGVTMMSSLGSVVKGHANLGTLDKTDHQILLSKGLTETDFAVWKQAQLEDWGGGNNTMLTPESIYRIPDGDVDRLIAPKIAGIQQHAQTEIAGIQARDAQDQQYLADRATKLQQWIADQRTRLDKMIGTADSHKAEALKELSRRLSSLHDRVDTASAFWRDTKANQIGLHDVYHAGIDRGRAETRLSAAKRDVKSVAQDLIKLQGELESAFKDKWFTREQDLLSRAESGQLSEHALAEAGDRFDRLFTEANARLTDRLASADEDAKSRIDALQERLGKLQGRIQASQSLYEIASDAQAPLGQLRAQGKREGQAVQAATQIREDVRALDREFNARKKELTTDYVERWGKRHFDFKDFEDRVATRSARRQQVVDRITRNIEPAIKGARQAAREQAAMKLLGAVLEESDVAVVEPGVKDRTVTGANLQRGTWKGELTRSFFLFKSFPIAMISRHWARGMSLPNAGGRGAYLATLIAATTLGGMVSLQVGEVLQGRDPRNMNPAKKGGVRNWIAAMLKGGSLGIYGDFLFSDQSQHGNSPTATVTGPVMGLAEDAFNLTQGNVVQAIQGKDTNVGAEAVRFVKGNTPGASLWYLKAAFDHLIWNQLSEYFSPGYLRKMRARAERDFGQSYYWDPAQPLPQRPPNLEAATGK